MLDVDAAVNLILEFKEEKPTFAILKHNNACGIATRDNIKQAYVDALAADPVSAFGGVLISNSENFGAITTSQNKLFISSATSDPISELLIKTPPKADTVSAASAST